MSAFNPPCAAEFQKQRRRGALTLRRHRRLRLLHLQSHEAGAAGGGQSGGFDELEGAVVAEDGFGHAEAAPAAGIEGGIVLHGEKETVSHGGLGSLVGEDALAACAAGKGLHWCGAVGGMLAGGEFEEVWSAVSVRVLVVFEFSLKDRIEWWHPKSKVL